MRREGQAHLNAGEGDSGGGVGSNHQGDEGRPQVTKHVGELWGQKEKKQTGLKTSCERTQTHAVQKLTGKNTGRKA